MSRKAKKVAKQAINRDINLLKHSLEATPVIRKQKSYKVCSDKKLEEFTFAMESTTSSLWGRKRWKTLNEREVLECFFEVDKEWSRKTILYVKDLVQLSEKQIYKWGYEKRRKLGLLDAHKDKSIDLKYITKIQDLKPVVLSDDFNSVVDSLFPEDSEEETLSDEQKEMYDKIRDQLLERSEKYEQQSDLDKLLNDRVPIQKIAIQAKALRYNRPEFDINLRKSVLDHWVYSDNDFKENFHQVISQPKFRSVMQHVGSDTHSRSKSFISSPTMEDVLNSENKIDMNKDKKLNHNFESLLASEDLYDFSNALDIDLVSQLSISHIFPIKDPIEEEDEECKFESLNDLCTSLLPAYLEEACYINQNNL